MHCIYGGRFRPSLNAHVYIDGGNLAQILHHAHCGAGVSGTVTTTWTNQVHYVSPAPGALTPTSVSGQSLTYNLSNLDTITAAQSRYHRSDRYLCCGEYIRLLHYYFLAVCA
jgi:hypothetical protein